MRHAANKEDPPSAAGPSETLSPQWRLSGWVLNEARERSETFVSERLTAGRGYQLEPGGFSQGSTRATPQSATFAHFHFAPRSHNLWALKNRPWHACLREQVARLGTDPLGHLPAMCSNARASSIVKVQQLGGVDCCGRS